MFSEKSFQAWRAQRGAVENADRARIRELAAAEVDAVLDQVRRERDAETARDQLAHSMRHATAARLLAEPQPILTQEQRSTRLAAIRRGAEGDVARWEAERQTRQASAAPAVQTRGAPQSTRATPATSLKIGDERSYTGHGRFRWDGVSWVRIGPA